MPADSASRRARLSREPVLIEVRDLHKTFVIPDQRLDTFKERVVHPLRRMQYRELRALREISFDVAPGRVLRDRRAQRVGQEHAAEDAWPSIYRADAGTIRMAGRLAPFIELGVGFNPELTARENVELNGVMMGLGRREPRRRLDSVLEFAELQEFVDLKLKNYSSGMMVRLAFAVMVEADADVMLVDEVLAVGDAAFAQKCIDVFREKRDAGKTLVLVTHDMATVQAFCDRAMLIHDGEQRFLGEPEEAAMRYYRLNFGRRERARQRRHGDRCARCQRPARRRMARGRRRPARRQRRARRGSFASTSWRARGTSIVNPVFNFHCLNREGDWVFAFSKELAGQGQSPRG